MVGPVGGSNFNGDEAKGLSCMVVLYAQSWLGFTSVCCSVLPIQRASIKIRINSSASCGEVHKVAPETTGTAVITSYVENSNTRLLLISCSQGILSSSSFSCYLLLRLLVYMYLSQLMRTFTNYLKCIVISS